MLALRLKQLREDKGIYQKELAGEILVSRETVAMYESGERMPAVKTLESIADYFMVSIDYLLGRTDVVIYSEKEDPANMDPLINCLKQELKTLNDTEKKVLGEFIRFTAAQIKKCRVNP